MSHAKTTIRNIDPDIFWDAKIYAAQSQQTIGEVINTALEQLLECDEEPDFSSLNCQTE